MDPLFSELNHQPDIDKKIFSMQRIHMNGSISISWDFIEYSNKIKDDERYLQKD